MVLCLACILAFTGLGFGAWWLAGPLAALAVSASAVGLYLGYLRCSEEGCALTRSRLEEGSSFALLISASLLLLIAVATAARSAAAPAGTGSAGSGAYLAGQAYGGSAAAPGGQVAASLVVEGPPAPLPEQGPPALPAARGSPAPTSGPSEGGLPSPAVPVSPGAPSSLAARAAAADGSLSTAWLDIRGMTCSGCKWEIENSLGRVAGVASVDVDFSRGTGVVRYDSGAISADAIAAYISDRIGYPTTVARTEVVASSGSSSRAAAAPRAAAGARRATFGITGMCCGGCAARIGQLWQATPGVISAEVNFRTGSGLVEYDPSAIDVDGVIAAVTSRSRYGVTLVEDAAIGEGA